jgi:HAD superfamily hydrolase (TIGR01484 family)
MSKRILICTDLDRTLLPNGKQPESPGALAAFTRLVSRPEVILAYVSGRHRELVEEAIRNYELPLPDWVIGDVGTTIYQVRAGAWLHWTEWEQDVSADWRGLTASDLRPLFSDLQSLRLQEESKQNRYKLSYYLALPADILALKKEMSKRLNLARLAASLIYSVDEADSTGLLDVLPALATKLHAVEFLMQHQGFDYTNTVFAGDSGNDLPVLASAVPSVLVANADCDVVEQAKTQALQQGTMAALYRAQGGFLGMNGNYSAGILEGIAHYHSDIRLWMEKDHKKPHHHFANYT